MKIITISREFASGGRELGKRLSDELGIPCWDHEIIDMVCSRHGFERGEVVRASEKDIRAFYPSTVAHRFWIPRPEVQQAVQVSAAEHSVMKELARQGDCIIVGRCADIILDELNPLNLFVYADAESKLRRCREREEEGGRLSEKEMLSRMKAIDRERRAYRGLFTETEWGSRESYHLCVNTSGIDIKAAVPALAEYARMWFSQRNEAQ